METKNAGIAIKAVSAVVPSEVVDNTAYIGKYDKRKVTMQLKVTGIRNRHLSFGKQEGKDLCLQAAKRLIQELDIDRQKIKVLIFVSQTTGMVTPSTAFWIHHELGLGMDSLAFDINLGCSGFVEGLSVAASLLEGQEKGTKALLLNGDTLSQYVDEDDFATCMMFGDGGTATLIEAGGPYDFFCLHNTQSSGYDKLMIENPQSRLYMDGMSVFNFTINDVAAQIQNVRSICDRKVDFYLLHQAQQYIVRNLMELCSLEEEKVLTGYENYGNVSGASIPLTICDHAERFRHDRDYQLLVSGFGVGLSYASAYIMMEKPVIFSVEM
ncbi:MAG: ketoacyl-ACP synthase III [Eubacterium sp.]|jgi:3-oxoacyl-[acyl-carrier-protein] synthase-3|nr:ketoacyl-ACP synthase III [Eubacterium sp.]